MTATQSFNEVSIRKSIPRVRKCIAFRSTPLRTAKTTPIINTGAKKMMGKILPIRNKCDMTGEKIIHKNDTAMLTYTTRCIELRESERDASI